MERMNFSFGEWAATWSTRVALRLYAAAEHIGQRIQSVRGRFVDFGQLLRNGRSRLQEALRQGETELATILADSNDPVIVTDDAHHILAANPAALTLLHVSNNNLHRFAIDAFLPLKQVRYFERSGPRFIKSAEVGANARSGRLAATRK